LPRSSGTGPIRGPRLLAGRRSRLFGVTLTLTIRSTPTWRRYLRRREGTRYEVVLSAVTAQRDPRRAIDTLLDYRCAAAILVGSLVREPWLSALGERLPVVVLGQRARTEL